MEQGGFSLGSWGCLLWDSVETSGFCHHCAQIKLHSMTASEAGPGSQWQRGSRYPPWPENQGSGTENPQRKSAPKSLFAGWTTFHPFPRPGPSSDPARRLERVEKTGRTSFIAGSQDWVKGNIEFAPCFVNVFLTLAHLRFCDSFSCQKASLWPGSKGVARKKHRRERKSTRRSPRASAD